MDLDSLSLRDLKQLQKDVEAAINNFKDRERRKALSEVEVFLRERGLTAADLNDLGTKKTRKPSSAKYANPADPSMTWTGRGRRPRWADAALAEGKSLSDLAI